MQNMLEYRISVVDLFVLITMLTVLSTSRPQKVNQSDLNETVSSSPLTYQVNHTLNLTFSSHALLEYEQREPLQRTEQMSFDRIFLLKYIKVGLMLSSNPEHHLTASEAPGDNNPYTMWYMNYDQWTRLYTIRSVLNPKTFICMHGKENDAKAKLQEFNSARCTFEQLVLTSNPLDEITQFYDATGITSVNKTASFESMTSSIDPMTSIWMSLAFRNPATQCFIAFSTSSLNSKKYCRSKLNQLTLNDISSIAHFDKERPEPQLVFQATTSLRDVFPDTKSTDTILNSIQTRIENKLPFNFVNWQTAATTPQYFEINPDKYQAIAWTILKHSYHTYQLPKVLEHSRSNESLANKWKKCSFNAYDLFSRANRNTNTQPSNVVRQLDTPAKNAGKINQEKFDNLSLELQKSFQAYSGKQNISKIDSVVQELNELLESNRRKS